MTEAEYHFECNRAELLGVPKPTWEEFLSSRKEISTQDLKEEEEETVTEQPEEVDARKEGFRRIGGGLDELNSILSSTQKKLNRFKTVCGSFSNLLKLHIGPKKEGEENGETSSTTENVESTNNTGNTQESKDGEVQKNMTGTPQRYTKGNTNSELDKLDSLINKAERAELSLSSQNKQMKKFLN